MSNTTDKVVLNFAAIDPYIESNIISPKAKRVNGKDFLEWGDKNYYPFYLEELYDNVPTLQTCINGLADYVLGDSVTASVALTGQELGVMNVKGESLRDQVHNVALDYALTGGFALQIVRGGGGDIVSVYDIPVKNLRTNAECDVFYYSEDWDKVGRKSYITYPKFLKDLDWSRLSDEEKERHISSILYIKGVSHKVYPVPVYASAVPACEIERGIDEFHLNSINSSFTPSMIVNFNNGIPSDEAKKEIERMMNEKFSGVQNGGRIMLCWNDSKEGSTTIESPKVEDFGARYEATAKRSRQQIFTSFRANPNLFGIPTDNNGFNAEEYESAFKLFNRTMVKPIQTIICDAYDAIFGVSGSITIKPFTLEGETEQIVK